MDPMTGDYKIETDRWVGFIKRAIRALARRVGGADPTGLEHFASIRRWVDQAEAVAVRRLRAHYSWAEIGRGAGMTRQAAHERWATTPPGDPWWEE